MALYPVKARVSLVGGAPYSVRNQCMDAPYGVDVIKFMQGATPYTHTCRGPAPPTFATDCLSNLRETLHHITRKLYAHKYTVKVLLRISFDCPLLLCIPYGALHTDYVPTPYNAVGKRKTSIWPDSSWTINVCWGQVFSS